MSYQLADSFNYWVDFKRNRISKLRYSVLKKLSKKSLPLFFKGGDIISLDPIANGTYESDIKALIDHFADNGMDGFLLDIGANIGLSSCQSGRKFKEVHMYEPNPNCVSILKINANIALRGVNYAIHEYGLGAASESLQLYVPYDNWGGAFVKSDANEYDDALLSSKDGYGNFVKENYDIVDVQIQAAAKCIAERFEALMNKGLTKGVIKVDAEGYEKFIVNTILTVKPKQMECMIIFENWKDEVTPADYFMQQTELSALYKLESLKNRYASAPRWLNSWLNFLRGGYSVALSQVGEKFSSGTYLLISKSTV